MFLRNLNFLSVYMHTAPNSPFLDNTAPHMYSNLETKKSRLLDNVRELDLRVNGSEDLDPTRTKK